MKTTRRIFLKHSAIATGLIFVPSGIARPGLWLYDTGLGRFVDVPLTSRGGLQAASVIKSRTFSSVVDNRIQLANSNFARLWSASLGTSWTTIRIGCRISMTDTGANLSGTPQFAFGICSGTTSIFQDATCTHWYGMLSVDPGWLRTGASPAVYAMSQATSAPKPSKKINTTITSGSAWSTISPRLIDATTANRGVLFLDATKSGANFNGTIFARSDDTVNDVSLATYLAQVVLVSPSLTSHFGSAVVSLAVDEGANGSFNAVNIAWDRTAPAIEVSDLAVVRIS